MDEQQKAAFLAAMREKPDQQYALWMHQMRGGVGAIVSASLVIRETLAEREPDPAIDEMMTVIDEKAQNLLDLMDILMEYNRNSGLEK